MSVLIGQFSTDQLQMVTLLVIIMLVVSYLYP